MQTKKLWWTIAIGAVLAGCAATPHVFQSSYVEEKLPEIKSINGSNTLSGSAFLRQQGGGVVSCAGNKVVLTKDVIFPRSAYAREVNSLSAWVRNASTIDPRHLAFERKLAGLQNSQKRETFCDVDGKFSFSNLAPGTYTIKSKVYWVVADAGQGGIVATRTTIPEGADNGSYTTAVTSVIQSCSIFGCPSL